MFKISLAVAFTAAASAQKQLATEDEAREMEEKHREARREMRRTLCGDGATFDWREGCYDDPWWCPDGGHWDGYKGKCRAAWQECPDGERWDYEGESCETDEWWCPEGERAQWDQTTKGPKCEKDPYWCEEGSVYVWKEKKCVEHGCDGRKEWVDRKGKCFKNPGCDWEKGEGWHNDVGCYLEDPLATSQEDCGKRQKFNGMSCVCEEGYHGGKGPQKTGGQQECEKDEWWCPRGHQKKDWKKENECVKSDWYCEGNGTPASWRWHKKDPQGECAVAEKPPCGLDKYQARDGTCAEFPARPEHENSDPNAGGAEEGPVEEDMHARAGEVKEAWNEVVDRVMHMEKAIRKEFKQIEMSGEDLEQAFGRFLGER